MDRISQPGAFVVMYSVIDKASFQRAEEHLAYLHDQDLLRGRPAILVGNKIDLARSRAVSSQGDIIFPASCFAGNPSHYIDLELYRGSQSIRVEII